MEKYLLEDVEKKVIELVKKRCDFYEVAQDVTQITKDTNLREDLEFDSIMLVVLQIDIEDAFHIRFNPLTDDCSVVFTTIRNICFYIQKCLEEG